MVRTRLAPPLLKRGAALMLLLVAGAATSTRLNAQAPLGMEAAANFDLAARWAPYKIRDLIHSTSITPNWINHGDKFWYEWETSAGRSFYLVDPAAGAKTTIFDNDRIAAELTRITRDPWDGQHLPIRNIRFISDNILHFEVESSQDDETATEEDETEGDQQDDERRGGPRAKKLVHHFEYTVSTRTLRELADYEAPDSHPSWAAVSPDTTWVVFSREFDLWMMSYPEYEKVLDARRGKSGDDAEKAEEEVEVEETRLTTDGEAAYSYGSAGRGDTDVETAKEHKKRQNPQISWSHNSQRFALIRRDQREVGDYWVVHVIGNERPELETYKYDLPGEESVTQSELWLFEMAGRTIAQVDDGPWADQRMGIYNDPTSPAGGFGGGGGGGGGAGSDEPRITKWLSPNELLVWRQSRDQHRVDVLAVDPATSAVRVVIEERLNTYVEHQSPRRLANGDLIWWSEADGWAHLYRYNTQGGLVARLTEGPWHVEGVVGVDEARGQVFFRANAREAGEDPYYQHLYRVGVDGAGLTLLNPGNFDHRVEMSESNRFFVDNYSRVDTTPASGLFNASGTRIVDLEVADFSQLMAAGYEFPEPYTVKSADGVTDIYGVMYKPYDFDPEKSYPIVQFVYPGPQTESVSKSFAQNAPEQALAQFGLIVVTIGNRGGHPARSKWYHNYGYGNLRDYGLADKKAGVEQLADRFDFIDRNRVGIYGHSGGGFMSTAAMLVYPDFFKVAVSSSGNHDNDVYNQNWSEKHDGVKEVVGDDGEVSFEYDIQKNSDLAANLKGHLLLTTGDIDNNVHHAGTHRMANALIRANKRFDFFVFPGQRHGYGDMGDYWFWLRAEYFVEHLLGVDASAADIIPLQVERPKAR
ncbi:MAG: DPP IV N-terminal domain-containing protein [Gemmatimonadetes bacterium]|nr:DPP IV N-terminal domain-containing protein [Gemmatimonadota bacterium]MDA1102787.1 DPP IV N-terminal domain-containing protein [Gemmatimonadota bacterium]